jgi:predicted nucleotidyltransferase
MMQIFELLGKKSTSIVLRYFLEHPSEETYATQLGKKLKIARKSLFDALAVLQKSQLIELRMAGRTKEYRLKRDSALVRQLKILNSIANLLPMLESLEGSGAEVYLYGSAARGEDTEKSDTDLLFIGERPEGRLLDKIEAEEKIKPIFLTFLEYSSLARKDKPFYERIEKDRIRLI